MSWAAKRKTTRVEDEAYCLLGLFDINMPTLYGEGRNAFYRLQEEIMRTSVDPSLFAWGWSRTAGRLDVISTESHNSRTDLTRYLFAPSPSVFMDGGHIVFNGAVNVSMPSMSSVYCSPWS